MKKSTAGGLYDANEPTVYFVAATNVATIADVTPWNLIATNDIASESASGEPKLAELHTRLDAGNRVLLDSGIFWLTQRHMRAHPGMTMDDALSLPPSEVDGFDWLFNNYVQLARTYEDRLWGYIELDQGGAKHKRETRARLEEMGLRPIPVYHPLNDGWDYLEELLSTYDRICMGNVVQANNHVRRHLLATLWERRRAHPDVWVHVLGLTMNEIVTVYPINSCDSSSWIYAMRFGAPSAPGANSMGDAFSRFTADYTYDTDRTAEDAGGMLHGFRFVAAESFFLMRSARNQHADVKALFGDDALLPPPDPREEVRQ